MSFYITPSYAPRSNGLYIFERDIVAKEGGCATVCIYASTRYILSVNGEYVAEGPCRTHEKQRFYDEVEAKLQRGVNHIEVKVLHTANYLTSYYKSVLPELAFKLNIGEEEFISDKSWSLSLFDGYTPSDIGVSCLAPFEKIDADGEKLPLEIIIRDSCDFRECGYACKNGRAPIYNLKKRPIPMIAPLWDVSLRVLRQAEGFCEYDAGEYVTARLAFDIKENSSLRIIYGECYDENGVKGRRDEPLGELNGYYDQVRTGKASYTYEPFGIRSFRYIRVEGDVNALSDIRVRRINYPLDISAEFECSDPVFNKMHKISKNTVLCCLQDIIMDCPYYEQQQYEMDSLIQLAVISRMSEDRRMHRKCIEDFSLAVTESGLLKSIYPSDIYQIIPGFSLFFIMMLRDYLENTNDREFVSRFVGIADGILSSFDACVRKNGFVCSSRYWDFVDWVPGWRAGQLPILENEANTVYSMYYAYALRCMSFICTAIGREGLAAEYSQRYTAIANTVNELCYDAERGLYKDGSVTRSFSMHTVVWAILSEVAPRERWERLISHLYDGDLAKCSFSMNYFTFRALEKSGRRDMIFSLLDGWRKMIDLGCTTWCENPDSPRSECHGWSSTPLYEFSSSILGVSTDISDRITISPSTVHLTFAKGAVPTRFGTVKVYWTVKDGVFSLSVSGADGTEKLVLLPNGESHSFLGESGSFSCSIS